MLIQQIGDDIPFAIENSWLSRLQVDVCDVEIKNKVRISLRFIQKQFFITSHMSVRTILSD
jgi:hypothetical protein